MAIFNEQVPDRGVRDPIWTNISHPISDVAADKSTSIAISGAADVLGSAVKAIDVDIKEAAKKDVQTGVDTLRDNYTAGLQQLRNAQIASTDKSLLPDETANVPTTVQNGIDKAKTIAVAMEQNAGKSNTTLYTGALNSLTKQLRSQYPGYRDYIDEQISAISGVHPANAFMKDLVEDINRQQENSKTEDNATKATLRSNADAGFHDGSGVTAAQVLALRNRGTITNDQAMNWLNSAKKVQYDTKTKADQRASRLGDEADAATSAERDLSTTVAQNLAHDWQTMTIGKNTDTAEGLFKFIQTNAGNTQVKDERSQQIGAQLVALRNASFSQRMAEAAEGGANSILAKMGGDTDKVKKRIEASYATFDNAIQMVFNQQWGAAYSHMNFNKAISQDSTNLLYNAPDEEVRKYNRMVGAINNISPQYGNDFFKNSLLSSVPQKEKEYLKSLDMELLTQPGKDNGSLTSVNSAIQRAKAAGMTSAKSYSQLMRMVDDVSNPKLALEHRQNLAEAFFNPQANAGLLSDKNFEKDRYDATLKREIPGKYSIWRKLSSDNVATGINEIGKTDPSTVNNYRTTMTREFGEQLFSRELRDAGESNMDPNTNRLYKIKFTDDKGRSPHFDVVRPDGSPMTMTEAIALRAPVGSLNRLNEGMSGLFNVYEKTGSSDPMNDVKSAILRYNYRDVSATNNPPGREESLTGTAKAIWQSLIAAQTDRLKKIQGRTSEPE